MYLYNLLAKGSSSPFVGSAHNKKVQESITSSLATGVVMGFTKCPSAIIINTAERMIQYARLKFALLSQFVNFSYRSYHHSFSKHSCRQKRFSMACGQLYVTIHPYLLPNWFSCIYFQFLLHFNFQVIFPPATNGGPKLGKSAFFAKFGVP